jgi:hypothetical protein
MNRLLLVVVLLLTLLLLIQRLVLPYDGSNPPEGAISTDLGRYEFQVQRGHKHLLLLRIDTMTGAMWKRGIEADGPWARLNENVIFAGQPIPETPGKRKRRMSPEATKELVAALAELRGVEVPTRPEDLSLLTDMVRKANPESLRPWAIGQIAGYPPKDAVPAFVGLLDLTNRALLLQVIEALKEGKDPIAIKPLRRLARANPSSRVSAAAAVAIASLEAEAARKEDEQPVESSEPGHSQLWLPLHHHSADHQADCIFEERFEAA